MRDAILVFIDGTICDDRHRQALEGTADFEKESEIMRDKPVEDAVKCMNELYKLYDLVYIGARSGNTVDITRKWLTASGFPEGLVVADISQRERMSIVKTLKKSIRFQAGIGDRWDDNELHLELGCMSIILEEYNGNFDTVRKYILHNKYPANHLKA
jgi:uncharacterized HAD superfamily protein